MMARKGNIKEFSEPNAMLFVLLYKDTLLSTNNLPSTLPSVVFDVLHDFEDVFSDEVPPGLLSYGPPWAHYLGGCQDRLLGGPLGLPDFRCTVPDGVKHKDCRGEVLG
jgi:hypothetical protein